MLKIIKEDDKPWYSDGLNFKCTECGQCCTGAPGYVWVTKEEIVAIAAYLKLSVEVFSRKYLRLVNGQYSLVEYKANNDCVFLKDRKCQIYPVRPKQCRTFPWWPQNLNTKESWEIAAKGCEGICKDAPLVPYETIKKALNS